MITENIHFKNIEQLSLYLENERSFYLNFNVDEGNDKYLHQIIKICRDQDICKGIVFHIDKRRFIFDKLFFLKDLIEQLLVSKKQVSMRGIPICVPRTLLGGYFYMMFLNNQVEEQYTVINDTGKEKVFLSVCESCVDKNRCAGFGDIKIEGFKPIVKKSVSFLTMNRSKPFDSNLVLLNNIHEAYGKYCSQEESLSCYRTVYYVSNIDFESEHSYDNRFVYSCDYISPSEYKKEFEFLRKHTIHKRYIDLLESIASIEKTSQIAYSLAQKKNIFRESFYMFVSKQYGDKILHDFHILYKYPKSYDMRLIGVGIDVISDATEGYKLYFQSSKNFLKSYIEPFDIDISQLRHNYHYLVLRLDKYQHLISYKIEMLILYDDLKLFKNLIDDYDDYDEKLQAPGLYNIAIEIVEDRISKINIYHRYYLTERSTDEI